MPGVPGSSVVQSVSGAQLGASNQILADGWHIVAACSQERSSGVRYLLFETGAQ